MKQALVTSAFKLNGKDVEFGNVIETDEETIKEMRNYVDTDARAVKEALAKEKTKLVKIAVDRKKEAPAEGKKTT